MGCVLSAVFKGTRARTESQLGGDTYITENKLSNVEDIVRQRCDEYVKRHECVLCMQYEKAYAPSECMHLCVCSRCRQNLHGACPICRREFKELVEVYW